MRTSGGLSKTAQENKAIAKKDTSLKGLIRAMEPQIKNALPTVMTPERFTRIVLTALSSNPKLGQCTPNSFLGAMMQAAQLGVEPNTPLGQAYLIPYRNKGTLECQFQLGYKGLIDLAYRSGAVQSIQAHEVHENDEFEYSYGLDGTIRHKPALKDRGPVIAYYGVWKTKDGGYGYEVMSVDDVISVRDQYSKAADSKFSPWATNFDAMAKKTVLKRALKYAPLKTEFARALSQDNTIKTTIAPDMADEPDETNYTDIEAEPVPDNIDPNTGEVHDTHLNHETEDDRILEESLNM